MIYAHGVIGGALALILVGPGPIAQMAGVALLTAAVVFAAVVAGVVMGNRLFQQEPPIPSVTEVDQQLSGGSPDMAEEIQEQLELIGSEAYEPEPAAFSLTATETRTR